MLQADQIYLFKQFKQEAKIFFFFLSYYSRVHWGSIYEAYGSLLNSKEPFVLKNIL